MTGGALHTALNAPPVRLVPPPAVSPPGAKETPPATVSAPGKGMSRDDLDAQRSVLQDRQAAIRREHARATLAGRPLPSRDELAQIEHALEALADAETLQHEDTRAAQEAAAADRRARMVELVARLDAERLDAMAKAGEAFAAGVDHLARARHLSAQIVAAAQSARAPVPASLTWQSLARRLGAMVGAALRPIASGHRRLGDLQWLDLPSARTPTEPIDWRSAETKATAADVAAITRSN